MNGNFNNSKKNFCKFKNLNFTTQIFVHLRRNVIKYFQKIKLTKILRRFRQVRSKKKNFKFLLKIKKKNVASAAFFNKTNTFKALKFSGV